jgi:single-strand DNA-binding protein
MSFGAELQVAGIITTGPTLTYTQGGTAAGKFTLLVSRTWTDKAGERKETRASFHVVTWGTLAENVCASVLKGDRVVVWGRLEERTWEDDHRQEHSRLELTASEVGASVLFSTLEVTKNPRRGESAVQTAPATRPASRSQEDEEPF